MRLCVCVCVFVELNCNCNRIEIPVLHEDWGWGAENDGEFTWNFLRLLIVLVRGLHTQMIITLIRLLSNSVHTKNWFENVFATNKRTVHYPTYHTHNKSWVRYRWQMLEMHAMFADFIGANQWFMHVNLFHFVRMLNSLNIHVFECSWKKGKQMQASKPTDVHA